jgi:hypothetical protein
MKIIDIINNLEEYEAEPYIPELLEVVQLQSWLASELQDFDNSNISFSIEE